MSERNDPGRPPGRGEITVFADPAGLVVGPTGIIGAPDGDVWFTSISNARVGRVRLPEGRIETFADPAGRVALPANIFPAADGRIWFTCLGSDRLGSIDPSADDPATTVRTYAHPAFAKPVALKAAGDGRLWFSLRGSNAIGSVDPCVSDPEASVVVVSDERIAAPAALFVDPDDRVWWVNGGDDTIGFMDATSSEPEVETFRPPSGVGGLRAWSLDHEGGLWLTTQRPAGLVRLDPRADDPGATAVVVTDPMLQTPDGIWCAADGALWFADTQAHAIVRHVPGSGVFTSFGGPPEVQGPFDIKAEAGSGSTALWFSDKEAGTVGRIST